MASPEVFVGLSGVRSLCNELKRPGNQFQGPSKIARVYLVDRRSHRFFDPSQEDEAISSVLKIVNDSDHMQRSIWIEAIEIPNELYEHLNRRIPPDQLVAFFQGSRNASTFQELKHDVLRTSAKADSRSRGKLMVQFVGLQGLKDRDPFSSLKILGILRSFKYLRFRDASPFSEDVDRLGIQPWSKVEGAFTHLDVSISRDISLKLSKALFCRLEVLEIVWRGEASVEMGSSSSFFETLLELPRLKSLSMIDADENIVFTF